MTVRLVIDAMESYERIECEHEDTEKYKQQHHSPNYVVCIMDMDMEHNTAVISMHDGSDLCKRYLLYAEMI